MNSKYQQLATTEEINQKITAAASLILNDFPDRTPLFVALLRGAAPFSTKLMSEIVRQKQSYHPELDYMMVSTYGNGQHAGEPHIVTDLAPSTSVRGREVVVIDDVLDKGITADFVKKHMKNRGAARVKLAVLCDKRAVRERDITADYVGFEFDDNWLVGMGMDDAGEANEGYRWLDEIWEIKQ